MGLEVVHVSDFVHQLIMQEDSLTAANNCRNAVLKIRQEAIAKFPQVHADYLVHPEARPGLGVHYSLLFSALEWRLLVNTVFAPGFPEYIGDYRIAVPTFFGMKITPEVL